MYVCIYGTCVCKYNMVQFGLRVCVEFHPTSHYIQCAVLVLPCFECNNLHTTQIETRLQLVFLN